MIQHSWVGPVEVAFRPPLLFTVMFWGFAGQPGWPGSLPPPALVRVYRDYDGDTVPRLAFIRAAQAIGLSVAEIREVIGIRDGGTPPCAHVLELIERHRAEVRARIHQLQQLERELALLA